MRFVFLLHAVFLFLAAPSLLAADAAAQAEMNYLLGYVERAEVRFIRGGTEYPPKEAAAHLRSKLGKAGDRVKSAEDFITGIASKSYLSGKPYQVKLANGSIKPAGPWLSEALEQHRKSAARK
ncbi:MAG: DUF5329 family protein [Verrucomicrobiota bacterium]